MKTTAKVFIWIGMILNFYLIFPIIVGINALNKLDTAKTKEELTTSAWLTFWFCHVIGGILMLQLKDYDLISTNTSTNPPTIIPTKMITHIKTSEVKVYKKQLYDNEGIIRVLLIVLSSLLLSGGLIVFSSLHYSANVSPLLMDTEAFIIVISAIIAGLFAAILILTLLNNFKLLKLKKILLCLVFVILIFVFVTSLIDSFCYKATRIGYSCGSNGYPTYWYWPWDNSLRIHPYDNCVVRDHEVFNNLIIFPILMTISSATLIAISIIFFTKICKIKAPILVEKNKTVKEKIMISPIEQEINNIKSLMDKGVINEEEYNTLRKGIIEKYSKN